MAWEAAPAGGRATARGSPLLAAVLGLSAYLGVSGVWILLGPRSEAGRMQWILHPAAGLVALLPWAWYQVPHFLARWRRAPSRHLVLGWACGLTLLAAMVSGAWVTAQAVLGTKAGEAWHGVHRATGLASFALVLAHGAVALLRPRGGPAARAGAAARGRGARGASWTAGPGFSPPPPEFPGSHTHGP